MCLWWSRSWCGCFVRTLRVSQGPKCRSKHSKWHKVFAFNSNTKLVLLLTDNMIKHTMMYPEVYFMDCTGRANRQKRELFISVVRSPSGKCFMSNVTVIPSGDDHLFLTCLLPHTSILTYIVSSCSNREGMGISLHYSFHFSEIIWWHHRPKE